MLHINDTQVQLPVSDGTQMNAYVAHPVGEGKYPGLIIFQEAYGVNAHIRDVTRRFAQQGLVAIAPELYHRTAPGFEGDYGDFAAVGPHMKALTSDSLLADSRAAFDWLASQPSVTEDAISTVGYCMGGRVAFLANSALPLRTVVSYYGGGIPPLLDRAASLHAPMLFFWGELDKHIPPEQRAEVIKALKQHGKKYINVDISDADHGFFCDQRPSYNPRASELAWGLTLDFLRQS